MIHDLMLPATGLGEDEKALSAAIALADNYGAHLSVLVALDLPLPIPGPWGITPDVVLSEMYAELHARGTQQAKRLRDRLERERISWEVHVCEARFVEPQRALAIEARHADLSVMATAGRGADDAGLARALFSALLFESGRPVLVVPSHHPVETPLHHAVVAWKPTREATRALHDALPLLSTASSIDVVTVDVDDSGDAVALSVDIATHLARHGLAVNVVNLQRNGTVATTLLRHAATSNAQLLIAGGYGHSRLREWVLGGTTRELLQAIHLPVLFSH